MEKRLFSVEWLAQSSRSGAQIAATTTTTTRRPRSPPGGTGAVHRHREAAYHSSPRHEAESRSGPALPGRPRTKFSAAQLQELERSFRQQCYIGANEKRRLAAVLNLSQSQIKTWFQNRRMKFKRQTQDAR
ncbi:VEX1 protein, partial [Jacana jacana]|nr:VEX1 protein [Jacana jacana]